MEQKPERLPSLLVALDAGFDGCSILAADVVMEAQDLFKKEQDKSTKSLHVLRGINETAYFEKSEVINLGRLPRAYTERDVLLELVKPNVRDEDLQLMAVTRNNVAFPLLSFSRRKGSACDYVQIGQEMDDESFIVVPPDHIRRKDIIADIQTLFKEKDPRKLSVPKRKQAVMPNVDLMTAVPGQHKEELIDVEPPARGRLLFNYFNIDALINERLGEFNSLTESLIEKVGKLALLGRSPFSYQDEVRLDGSVRPTKIDIVLHLQSSERGEKHSVDVRTRPVSMSDHPLVKVFQFEFDKTDRVEIKSDDAIEFDGILMPFLNNRNQRKSRAKLGDYERYFSTPHGLPAGLGFLTRM